uniref:Uncharacterized protein n=1 Tax=Wuchereria bancrofti TaxID=6293 RepID=A0AAF5RY18_WUCBA
MDEDQLLDYEEEQEEMIDGNKAENGSVTDKKIKFIRPEGRVSHIWKSNLTEDFYAIQNFFF